jgi:predicted nucleotidyltransferase/uncharacterized protein (UPF0332 family)
MITATLERKQQALHEFTARLLASPLGGEIAKIVLYGSAARGDANEESDVDVLVFAVGALREVGRVAAETASAVWVEQGERVEPMVYSWNEEAVANSPFLHRVLTEGQEVYHMAADALKRKEIETLYGLAGKYLRVAKTVAQSEDEGHWRAAIDIGYNAVELCAKAFLRDVMETLPKTHDGIQQMFSDKYIKTGAFPHDFAHDLGLSLNFRHSARYDGNAAIRKEMVEHVLRVGDQMLARLVEQLAQMVASGEGG